MGKIRWNLHDYARRVQGRFHNQYGAHVGFARRELKALLTQGFAAVADASWTYFTTNYSRYLTAWAWVYRMWLEQIWMGLIDL